MKHTTYNVHQERMQSLCHVYQQYESKPTAVIQYIYDFDRTKNDNLDIIESLTKHNYAVVVYDLLEHDENKMYVPYLENKYHLMVEQQLTIFKMLCKNANMPVVLYGHGLGGYIALSILTEKNIMNPSAIVLSDVGDLSNKYHFLTNILNSKANRERQILENNNELKKNQSEYFGKHALLSLPKQKEPPTYKCYSYSLISDTMNQITERSFYDEKYFYKNIKNVPMLILANSNRPELENGKLSRQLESNLNNFGFNTQYIEWKSKKGVDPRKAPIFTDTIISDYIQVQLMGLNKKQ